MSLPIFPFKREQKELAHYAEREQSPLDLWSLVPKVSRTKLRIRAKRLMDLLTVYPPRHFFCVSTEKDDKRMAA